MSKLKQVATGILSFSLVVSVWGGLNLLLKRSPEGTVSEHLGLFTEGLSRGLTLSHASSAATKAKLTEGESNVLMNDPTISEKWGIVKTQADKAWSISQGSKDIVVAVIDTGIDAKHKDLKANLWVNAGESGFDKFGNDKATNGIDDDHNGFVDDVHGWNFVQANNNLTDNHSHGTHIAGIIGGAGGPGGVRGVAPNVSLMVLKYYDPKAPGNNNLKNTVDAIKYAVKMNAKIINYSGGGLEFSQEEHDAIAEAEKKGILFVAAAGNEQSNSDEADKHYYPADYQLRNIISVTAVNKPVNVLKSSNYGRKTVDIAAPGEGIKSTVPGDSYQKMTGTSQATAFVTGVAALVMAHNREFSAFDVKKYILRTGDEYQALAGKTSTSKLLNSYKALTSLDMGVGASGVVATNTATIPAKTFSTDRISENKASQKKTATTSPVEENEVPGENLASFGKDFLKAVQKMGASPGPASANAGGIQTP